MILLFMAHQQGMKVGDAGGGPAAGVSRDNIAPVRKQRRLAWQQVTLNQEI
jgi:hypothetical protein